MARKRLLKNHGSSLKEKYINLIIGTNSRLDAIQAAILMIKLKHFSKWNKQRSEIAAFYSQELKNIGDVITPVVKDDRNHIFHQYTIRAKKRNQLKDYLTKNKISTTIYYPFPLHLQPALKHFGFKNGNFPESEKASKEVLCLPIYPEILKKGQKLIIKKIKEFYV